ncbi:uncharacterized protein LOC122404299, partial [Colletes gigas]|uniref:uncharacterized protein LOC122404299 n=1 Tax=Colletes gigas TaxID=935657 RepID=UPI001C9ABC41
MYRQIRVDDHDVNFQRILWRESPSDPVEEYQLLTVTYGTTPAPYLALRVLKQLIEDEGSKYPHAVPVLNDQVYVDDFLFGSDSIASLLQIRNQTTALLAQGGFSLRKWASNHSELLSDIDPSEHGLALGKSLNDHESTSVLGLIWNPGLDQFQFQLQVEPVANSPMTKRMILSSVAKIFDPLGWITPFVISGKILIQRLWSLKSDWDDYVPQEIQTEWQFLCRQLSELKHLSIPRKLSTSIQTNQSLHGFADASTAAYAAVVYVRNVLQDGSVCIRLAMAKSRVAPVKTVSVPRLELCAALLLARLLKFVQTALKCQVECHCWTDSSITLTWVNQPPSRWKTFIANRVAKIQTLIPTAHWHHVPTEDNPADCASRGIPLSKLIPHPLWWSGPCWLRETSNSWPKSEPRPFREASLEETTHEIPSMSTTLNTWELETRYSSWPKLLRITAYLKRFVQNLRRKSGKAELTKLESPSNNAILVLTPDEISQSKLFWLKKIQSDVFQPELERLKASRRVSTSSSLISLNPYIDANGLIRAKGRLMNSDLSEK